MFLRRLLLWLVILLGAFLLFMVLSFYLYPVFNQTDDELPGEFELGDLYEYDYEEFGPQAVSELLSEINELEEELEELREKEEQDVATIDSLYAVNRELEDELRRSEAIAAANGDDVGNGPQQLDAQLEEVASNLLVLNEEELAPIVNRLSDNRLLDLYENSSNMQRQQLLRALEPAKAATLVNRASS